MLFKIGNKYASGQIPWNKGKKTGQIPWMKGKKHTDETKQKMKKRGKKSSMGMLGKKGYWTGKKRPPFSKTTKEKISESHKGEKHWNWKGGITSLYGQIRVCFKYRQWRSDVFTRDDFICQQCGDRGGNLNADHIKPFAQILYENNIKSVEEALGCEEMWNINNGRTLCISCHRKTNSYAKKLKVVNSTKISTLI